MEIDLSFCRSQFPAIQQTREGRPFVYLDGPGGTQVPQSVIDTIATYLAYENSNTHGSFLTSMRTDERIDQARAIMADFFGSKPCEVAFGSNMTTLNFALSRALGRSVGPGDRVVITDLDHEANRAPWLALAEKGAEVVSVRVNKHTCTLDMDDLRSKVTRGTRIVAVGYASNAVGTINPVETICQIAREAGAVSVIDAVHYAAHGPIDVKALGCDFLLCSAYKFFGPHIGVLYGRDEAFDALSTYKVVCQDNSRPFRIETGTLNHEGIAGVVPAVEFIASLGDAFTAKSGEAVQDRRSRIVRGMEAIHRYEQALGQRLWEVLTSIPGLTVYGQDVGGKRCPTYSFTIEGAYSEHVARFLGDRYVFVWDGDFYARTLVENLGLTRTGGLVRVGLAPYNTYKEIDLLGEALGEFLSQRSG